MKELKDIYESLKNIVLLLRFRTLTYTKTSRVYCTINQISKILKINPYRIRKFCEPNQETQTQVAKYNYQRLKLTLEHINYLTKDENLSNWKHLSLRERCVRFHRQYPDIKISPSSLRVLYKRIGIKHKCMRTDYKLSPSKQIQIHKFRSEVYPLILDMIQNGLKLIYLDETIFKAHQVKMKSWSRKYTNQCLYKEGTAIETLAAIVLISPDQGLEAYGVRPLSIKIPDIIEIFECLDQKYPDSKIHIFLDNLKAHHSKRIREFAEGHQWKLIFNAPYSSKFNCIEYVFSLVKDQYKRALIGQDFQLSARQHKQLVSQCISNIQKEHCQKSELKTLKLMSEYLSQNMLNSKTQVNY